MNGIGYPGGHQEKKKREGSKRIFVDCQRVLYYSICDFIQKKRENKQT